MRSIMTNEIVPRLQHSYPKTSVPRREGTRDIDIVQLVKESLKYFDKDVIMYGYDCAHKQCRIPGFPRTPPVLVPTEAVYAMELITVLKHWIPSTVGRVIPHPNCGINVAANTDSKAKKSESTKKTDLIIVGGRTVLLELVANAPASEVEEHFDRASRDMKALDADEAFVLHFTVAKEVNGKFGYPFPKEDSSLGVIHIYHNSTFSYLQLVYKDKNGERMTEDIEL